MNSKMDSHPDNERDDSDKRRISYETQTQASQAQVQQSQTTGSSIFELEEDVLMPIDGVTDCKLFDRSGDDMSNAGTDFQQALAFPEPAKSPQMPESSTPNRRRSKRVRTNKIFGADQEDCAETDCDDPSSQEDKITCAGPGCNTKVCIHWSSSFMNLKSNVSIIFLVWGWMSHQLEDGSVMQIVE
jgi:hypothetical protein